MATKVDDLRLYALTPADVTTAQGQLRGWIDEKRQEVEADVLELRECVAVAADARMQTEAWRKRLTAARKRLEFLEKCGAALDAGFLVIPNLPLNVFAIRVSEGAEPSGYEEQKNWKPGGGRFETSAEQLPVGTGQYVNPMPKLMRGSRKEPGEKGGEVTIYTAQAIEFRDVSFPVVAVKPEILNATKHALAARIFDEIGLVQDTGRRDPIVVGRIKHWKDPKDGSRGLTCFIGWWFDTQSLD